MNDNFDFSNEPQNEMMMTPQEEKLHKKVFSRLCLSVFVYMMISQLLPVAAVYLVAAIKVELLYSQTFLLILSSAVQYLIALPVLFLIIAKMPTKKPAKTPVNFKRFFKFAAISIFFMYIGNYISSTVNSVIAELTGVVPENPVASLLEGPNIIISTLIVGIIGPIVEELIFRKLLIDRLTPYGEKVAIFFPALIFGLCHGNFDQLFYAFLIGTVFSYIYIRTGKIIYSTILHMFINLFFGIFPTVVFSMIDYEELMNVVMSGALTEEYIMANIIPLTLFLIYSYGTLVFLVFGIIFFIKNFKKLHFNQGEVRFPRGSAGEVIFFNAGTILLFVLCILLIAYSVLS